MADEEALRQCDAGDSLEIPPNAAIHGSLEVENGEGLELEKNDEFSAVNEVKPLMVVEVSDQLTSFEVGDREKSEYGDEHVEESKGLQDLERKSKVENVEKSKGVSDELATVDESQVENVEKADAGEEEIAITEEMVDDKLTAVNKNELDENKGEDDEAEDEKVEGKNGELLVEEVDTDMGMETETIKSESGGKRKRKEVTPVKAPSRKIVGEDVCFICLVGGDLVLCDRRGCPKAYHRSCVDHDGEFFKTKGRWNCAGYRWELLTH